MPYMEVNIEICLKKGWRFSGEIFEGSDIVVNKTFLINCCF